ncbi:MAG: hypothetical protein QM783_14625 [Phycisphaerales bacterium]
MHKTFALFVIAAAFLTGCAGSPPPELTAPEVLVSPYQALGTQPLWAVAPLRNESGTNVTESMAVADELVARINEARGMAAIPMNRVIGTMRAIGMAEVNTPSDARALATALGVDGIVVGSITSWDPYDPPRIGLTLGLFAPSRTNATLDARELTGSATERTPTRYDERPLSVVVNHFDARNHEVLMSVQRYAAGRTDYRAPLGWRSYTANMDQYVQFVAYQTLSQLLDAERLRLARATPATPKGQMANGQSAK